MILEIAEIRIEPGRNAEFEAAVRDGMQGVIAHADGFRGFKLNRGVESPERYVMMVYWETLEHHTVGFRGGPLFPRWRAIVGPFFAVPPTVEHFELAAKSD